MKTIKVYDDVHAGVKVEAAKTGRTSPNIASLLLRWALRQVAAGKVRLDTLPADSSSSAEPALAGKGGEE